MNAPSPAPRPHGFGRDRASQERRGAAEHEGIWTWDPALLALLQQIAETAESRWAGTKPT